MRDAKTLWVRVALLTAFTLAIPACMHKHEDPDATSAPGGGAPVPVPLPHPNPTLTIGEIEPNNAVASAQTLPIGTAVAGSLETIGDVDHFSFFVSETTAIRIECFANRLEQWHWTINARNSADLTLLAADGVTVLHRDADLFSGDPDIPGTWVGAGQYYIRLRTADPSRRGDLYALVVRQVDADFEQEAPGQFTNDTIQTAEGLTGNSGTVAGHRDVGAIDLFALPDIGTDSVVDLRMIAALNGPQPSQVYDSRIEVLNATGDMIAAFDDGVAGDPIGSVALGAGTHYLRVTATGGAGAPGGRYLLEWSRQATVARNNEANDLPGTATAVVAGQSFSAVLAPPDVDYFSVALAAGSQVLVQVLDRDGGHPGAADAVVAEILGPDGTTVIPQTKGGSSPANNFHTLTTIIQASGTYFVRVSPDSTPAPTLYRLRIGVRPAGYETEPNSFPNSNDGQPLPASRRMAGMIDVQYESDVFTFAVVPNELVVCRLYGNIPSPTAITNMNGYSGFGSVLTAQMDISGHYWGSRHGLNQPNWRSPTGLRAIDACLEVARVVPDYGYPPEPMTVRIAENYDVWSPGRTYVVERD